LELKLRKKLVKCYIWSIAGSVTFCPLQGIIEGKIKGGIEVRGRRGTTRKTLPDDLREIRGYCHLKWEALERTKWRARFGRDFGAVVTQTNKRINELSTMRLLAFIYTGTAQILINGELRKNTHR
jgi:hypothetical protein